MLYRLGTQHFSDLDSRDQLDEKILFLIHLDKHLPKHVLCSKHGVFHLRSALSYSMRADHDNHIFRLKCQERHTYVDFATVQRACRSDVHGPAYGSRVSHGLTYSRYTDRRGWCRENAFVVNNGRFLVKSQRSVHIKDIRRIVKQFDKHSGPNANDYFQIARKVPCCSHLDDELTYLARCAIRHTSFGAGLQDIRQCEHCESTYRCAVCATEYAVEIKPSRRRKNQHMLVLTAWTDLGSGKTPRERLWRHATLPSAEIAAHHSIDDDDGEQYIERDGHQMFDTREARSVRFRYETKAQKASLVDWDV